jgi:cystathionine gamma-synthase
MFEVGLAYSGETPLASANRSDRESMARFHIPFQGLLLVPLLLLLCLPGVRGWSHAGSIIPLVRRSPNSGFASGLLLPTRRLRYREGMKAMRMGAEGIDGEGPLHPATIAAQTTGVGGEDQYDGIVPAIYPASTYLRDVDLSYPKGKCYSRADNPTVLPTESTLCSLEVGQEAMLFASGMAAATTVFQAVLSPGDHVVIPHVMYWALRNWVHTFCDQWGVAVTEVDMTAKDLPDQYEELDAALAKPRTKLVWIETPANPTWLITDISAVSARAHEVGALCAVDSTTASPVLTRPLILGADVVMHSATKYLNGHSDLVAGALVASVGLLAGQGGASAWAKMRALRGGNGAILGAFDAWLLQRGMRTLFVRVERQCATALAIARHFDSNKDNRRVQVLYPGLNSFPGHAVARAQMSGGFGGMLSLRIKGGREAAIAFAGRCRVFRRATSLGGVESLIEHRASIEGARSPVPDDLLRVSVGIESAEDLIADLEAAAAGVEEGVEGA